MILTFTIDSYFIDKLTFFLFKRHVIEHNTEFAFSWSFNMKITYKIQLYNFDAKFWKAILFIFLNYKLHSIHVYQGVFFKKFKVNKLKRKRVQKEFHSNVIKFYIIYINPKNQLVSGILRLKNSKRNV